MAVIVSPPAGAPFKVGGQIKLQGYAVDLEEGMVSSGSLSWSSDVDVALGAGGLLEGTLRGHAHDRAQCWRRSGQRGATVVVGVPSPAGRLYTYLPLVLR